MMRSCSAMRCASRALTRPRGTTQAEMRAATIQISCHRCHGLPSRITHQEGSIGVASGKRSFVTSRSLCTSPARQLDSQLGQTKEPSKSVPEQLRSVMRLLTNPVVVCTARDTRPISNNDNGKERSAPRAMTMSSFTSLSLSPTPLVTFNVATPSRTLEAIKNSGEFNVHILAGDGSGALVAENFTRGNTDDVFERLVGARCKNTTIAADGEGSSSPMPILEGDGVLYVLRCRVAADQAPEGGLIHVRDHVIVIGEVLEVIPGSCIDDDGFGLAYADRSYRAAGDVIAKH